MKQLNFQRSIHIFLFLLLNCLGIFNLRAQSSFPSDSIFNQVDSLPEFQGGSNKLDDYIHKNLYKRLVKYKINTNGSFLWATFIVEKDGTLSAPSCYPDTLEYSKEVIGFINSMPKWKPGKYDGQIVRTRIVLPIQAALASQKNTKTVYSQSLLFYNLGYQYSAFLGSISNFLESANGISFEMAISSEPISDFRLNTYFSYIKPTIENSFNRKQAFWEKGRKSNLLELGLTESWRLFSTKNTELMAFFQGGINFHTPSKSVDGDLIGIRKIGFSGGLGTNFLYFFNPKDYPHKVAANFKWKTQRIVLGKPLNGSIINLNVGLVYFFY